MGGFSAIKEADFGGETRRFRLRLGELEMLERRCDAGPMQILRRLAGHDWRVQDVRQPILLGLEGGGTDPATALMLVRRYCDPAGIANHVGLAFEILDASLWMPEDASPGKATGEGASPAPSASPSPPSTATAS